jgi:uncharacterized protein (TIGR00730 family)
MKRLCVFCGSNRGSDPVYTTAARSLGTLLAREQIGLVFGGGSVGLMGEIANAVLAAGGEAVGVIPHGLWAREVGHKALTRMHVVDTMHERKAMMADLSDGFIALPGGLGTLEEIFEVWTWAQLGMHAKPLGFLNVGGFYDPLLQFLDAATETGFIRSQLRNIAVVDDDPSRLLERFRTWQPPQVEKWLTRPES